MQNVKIPSLDYELSADWYEGEKPEVLVIIPGWSSNKRNYEEFAASMVEQTGMCALTIDLAGHGESPLRLPELMPAQNFLDVVAVYDWLVKNHPRKTVNIIGASYGAYLAAQLVAYRPVSKLVLRAPAIYRPEDFYQKWGNIDREATRAEYRSDAAAVARHPLFAAAASFTGRTLVVVHEKDEEIPRATSDAYIKGFHADEYLAEGLTHRMAQFMSQRSTIIAYHKAIADWLNKTS